MENSEVVENDSREFDFEDANGERVVREYLHHRPMSAGTWTFETCRVMVTYRGGGDEEVRLEGDVRAILVGNPDDPEYRTMYSRVAEDTSE
jgi:hypothetical protein